MSRRQFAIALAALWHAQTLAQQQTVAKPAKEQRAAAIAAFAASRKAELAQSGAGTWDKWIQRLEPARAQWKVVAGGSMKGRNDYIFNKNALNYLVDTNLEAGPENTHPLDTLVQF